MSENIPELSSKIEESIFSEKELADYRIGCENIGIQLAESVKRIRQDGKIPTIVIPSRGAVPIFLMALNFLDRYKENEISESKLNFYPTKFYDELIGDSYSEKKKTKEIDVVYYPFTADVSFAQERISAEIDRKIRKSAVVATLDLLYGDKKSLDLKWYYFILNKLNKTAFEGFLAKPSEICESLSSIKKNDKREIILIDTVLSGRATSQITEEFNKLGHPITPLFAVDNIKSGFRGDYRNKIRENCKSTYMENLEDNFIHMPLISEDTGASLLGVNALNVSTFNQEGIFNKYMPSAFQEDFYPQSCIWIPPSVSKAHNSPGDAFSWFFSVLCQQDIFFDIPEENKRLLALATKYYLTKDGRKIIDVDKKIFPSSKIKDINKTRSEIIEVDLEDPEARRWIREFATSLDRP